MDAGPLPRLVFNGFAFDPARGALFGVDGVEVPLRPKTFTMLRHLLANPGRLIAREELLDTVWPGVFVSDDSITQCVGELRRALGPDGAALLRTVPKRGYVFDAAVEARAAHVRPDHAVPISPEPAGPAEPVRRAAGLPASVLPVGLIALAVLLAGIVLAMTQPAHLAGVAPAAALTAQQDEARRLYVEGRAAFEGRVTPDNWLAARALYERAIQADPSYAPPYAEAAFTYTNMVSSGQSVDRAGDLARGEALARRAVALAPDLGLSHSALGAVLRNQRRPAEALQSYRMAVALDPTMIPAMANVSLMLILLGRPQEAIAPIEAAIAARPDAIDLPQWRFYLGLAQFQAGIGDHGAAAFRQSLEPPVQALIPADARRLYLAAALGLSGQTDAAREIATAARARTPALTLAWFRAHRLSDEPDYLAQAEKLYAGLTLAGVPD